MPLTLHRGRGVWKSRFRPLALVAAVSLLVTVIMLPAAAVHADNLFELGPGISGDEGGKTNIRADGVTTDGPDWANNNDSNTGTDGLFGATGNKLDNNNNNIPDCEEPPGKECAFITDPSAAGGLLDPTTFSGFGTSNKNGDPISPADCSNRVPPIPPGSCNAWGWDPGNVPAKDDLTNVYAYEVIPSSGPRAGHVIIYSGLEREAPNGDSHIDLEYFLSPVGRCQNPTCFTGVRTVGDVAVSMDFLKGGALGSVTVRKWDGSQYVLQGAAGGQGCFSAGGGSGDDICAFNNAGSIDGGPWPNLDNHGSVITSLPANAFTEIGVDVTNVLGESPCIASFMGKTRSSGSFTSELKDFAGPTTFSVCAPSTSLTKSASPTKIHSGDLVTYTYTETNDGKDPMKDVSVSDDKCSPVSYVSGDSNNNNILDPKEVWTFTCSVNLTQDTTNTAIATGTDTITGKKVTWCQDPSNPPANTVCDQDERAQATVTVIHPGTNLTENAAITVTFTYTEANTGDDAISNPTVTDAQCSPVTYVSGDTDNNGILDVGETWTFTCSKSTNSGDNLTLNSASTGSGKDSLGGDVGGPNDPKENESVDVTVTHHHHQ